VADGGLWTGNPGTPQQTVHKYIPIRFPHSCGGVAPMPLRSSTAKTRPNFEAFARVGDLNQVLAQCQSGDGEPFWPWINRVAKRSTEAGSSAAPAKGAYPERWVKWDWLDGDAPIFAIPTSNYDTDYSRANAANVFSVGGPWTDNVDNDGDGKIDDQDTGKAALMSNDFGHFAGPEVRVAGKINLNTALDTTLTALANGVGSSGLMSAVKAMRANNSYNKVIRSPALILRDGGIGPLADPDARGVLEARDMQFTRISNIATVRSDTYSIYGTVQWCTGGRGTTIMKVRHFWALVDRSQCTAYNPTTTNFAHPRIMNFQWLD
jgi:hypothetical protein